MLISLKSQITKILGAFIVIIFTSISTYSQETLIVGQVFSYTDKSPIPNVNIYFKNSQIGTKTNDEGFFMIRTYDKVNSLVFSCIGYKTKDIKIKSGQSLGLQMELTEENTLLEEVFVIPGANPALDLMKRIRSMKVANDQSNQPNFYSDRTEQNLVLLGKLNQKTISKRIFNQLISASVTETDTSLTIPLYMSENKLIYEKKQITELNKNTFNTDKSTEKIIVNLLGSLQTDINFYKNTILILGKSIISPLSDMGNVYYKFYLADSVLHEKRKAYKIHFWSKNLKNLALNGTMMIDSLTLALIQIDAKLPTQANMNYIQNLQFSQNFKLINSQFWSFNSEQMTLNMNYDLFSDSLGMKPDLFIRRSIRANLNENNIDSLAMFANSHYKTSTLNTQIKNLNETPILKTAKWLADVILTGYMQIGKVDIGKIQNILRTSEVEGLRFSIPFKTNEHLWKNLSLGGHLAYGTRNKQIQYSGQIQYKFPTANRKLLTISYFDDYRSNFYDQNNFLAREKPLVSEDEDITATVFAFRSANNLSKRKEFSSSFLIDWNSNIESNISFRNNELSSSLTLPFTRNGVSFDHFNQQSLTISTRFSNNEKVYDDYMQRIYIANTKPVFYAILEGGRYNIANEKANYGKIRTIVKQKLKFDFGSMYYSVEGGLILGKVPYPLLSIPTGSATMAYSQHQFGMMKLYEFAADKYLSMHSEINLNGIVLNQIPLINRLNLREMFSFKMFYGTYNTSHNQILDMPVFSQTISKPYMEIGVGFSNIFRLLTLQSVWRLCDSTRPDDYKWGIRSSIQVSF
jgi:hypothetical protein